MLATEFVQHRVVRLVSPVNAVVCNIADVLLKC